MDVLDTRLPVTLLTGALGSGKTTLLNRILTEQHGIKFGVIVNEFGELSIDHHLVVGTDEQVVELANGCVCCTVREDLLDAMTRILKKPGGVEYLLVETTGLADPRPVAQTFLHEDLCDDVRLDAILTVLDAANFHDNLLRSGTTIDQILAGDILLLNKVDLVSDAMRHEIKEEIGDLNPAARLLETVNAEVDLRLILDVDVHRAGEARRRGDEEAQRDGQELLETGVEADSETAEGGDFVSLAKFSASAKTAGSHLSREEISSVSFTAKHPFDYERLGEFLEALPKNIFRGKGLLWIDGYDDQLLFHLVGDRSTATLHHPWPPGERLSKLVLIGKQLDQERLLAQLDACLLKK